MIGLLLATSALTGAAHAQTKLLSNTSVDEGGGGWGGSGALALPPPIRLPSDPNGVDLSTGAYTYSQVDVSIGAGAGELTYERSFLGGGWRDNQTGTLNLQDDLYYVSLGSESETFSLVNGQFVSQQGAGATLSFDGASTYTYRSADGAVAIFSKTLASSSPSDANEGRVVSITSPNGVVRTFHYKTVQPSPGLIAIRLQSVTNSLGYQLKFAYAAGDGTSSTVLTKVTGVNNAVEYCNPSADSCTFAGAWPSVTYSAGNATDAIGRVTQFGYAANGALNSITLPGRAPMTIIYNASGQVASVSNGIGTWTYTYASGQTTVTDPLSRQRVLTIDATLGLVLTDRDALNQTTSYSYDDKQRPVRVTFPDTGYQENGYDSRGNVISSTRAGPGQASVTSYASYSANCTNPIVCNQPNSVTDAKGQIYSYTYDQTHGGILTITSPEAADGMRPQTRFGYTLLPSYAKNSGGALVQAGAVWMPTSSSACSSGPWECVGSALEVRETLNYAGSPNLLPTSATKASGDNAVSSTQTMTYDAYSNLLTLDGPLPGAGDTTRYFYDALGRETAVVSADPDGAGSLKHQAVRFTYHANGALSSAEEGRVDNQSDAAFSTFAVQTQLTSEFDGIGRNTKATRIVNGQVVAVTQISYDAANRLTCQTERMNPAAFSSLPLSACTLSATGPNGPDRIQRFEYNAADQVVAEISGYGTSQALTVKSTAYQASTGLISSITDGRGDVTAFEYDGFGRLKKIKYPNATGGGSSASDYAEYTYSNLDEITSIRRRDGQSISYGYDNLGRPVSSSAPATTYGYDHFNRVVTASSAGQTSSFTYDALGRNTGQSTPWGSISYGYDPAGRRTRITWPDGFYVTYNYDNVGQITQVLEYGSTVLGTYSYDDLGRRTVLSRGNGTSSSYGYDGAANLGSITHDLAGSAQDVTLQFNRDAIGRLTSRSLSNAIYDAAEPSLGDKTYTFNGLNQIASAGGVGFSHDARGNVTSDGVNSYGYDILNRLVSAAGVTLSYDPVGRLSQINGSASARFAYSGDTLVAEYSSAGALLRRYVPGAGSDDVLVWYEGNEKRWYLQDDLNSPIAVLNGSGQTASINRYDEFGVPEASNTGRLQFTGQMWLPEVGLYHYRARAYSPVLGRFMQPDPIGHAGGVNLYTYVGNDPVNDTDPTGRISLDDSTEVEDITVTAPKCREGWTCVEFLSPSDGGGGGEPALRGPITVPGFDGPLTECPVPGKTDLNKRDTDRGQGDGKFGPRVGRDHWGNDITAPVGTPVVAAGDGEVVRAQRPPGDKGFGGQVVIKHRGGVYTQYAHLKSITVREGQSVRAGDQIGAVGRSGNVPSKADSHLHFEVRKGSPAAHSKGGNPVDPQTQLPSRCLAQ